MNTLKTKNMTNLFKELYDVQSKRCELFAEALGTAKGYLKDIKKHPEEAYETADKALKLIEELSNQIYKPIIDAKV